MRRAVLILGCLAAMPACSMEPQEPAPSPSGSGGAASVGGIVPSAMTSASASAVSSAAGAGVARSESVSNALIDFSYAYPAAAGVIPALKTWLDRDLDKQKQALIAGARQQQAEAKKDGFPFRALSYWIDWKVVTDLPGWLSLSTLVGTYEGGAHPNYTFATILWDKQAGQRREPIDLFTSKAALAGAIRADFCRELDKQRAKKRGGDGKLGGGISEFDTCVDPLDSTLILGSSNGKAFDRIGILVPPYEAGPYAEGSYEVTLRVTPAVLAAVKPEFRPSFVAAR